MLPGIRAISWVPAELLPINVKSKLVSGVPVAILTVPTPITIIGEPVCEVTQEHINGGIKVTTSLEFVSNDSIPLDQPLGLVIQDCNGRTLLIGEREKPWAVVNSTNSSGKVNGEVNATTYNVKWYCTCAPVPCTALF